MSVSKNAYLTYLEEELEITKALLLKTNKSYLINNLLPEITLLEQALTRLKSIPCTAQHLERIDRQEAPTGNTPPRPSSDILSSSASPIPVPLDPIVVPDKTFTLEELQTKYNGLNGNPSYVALYSLVFDVSNISTWGGGTHFGLLAGTDATPGARACGFHNPGLIMRIMPAVGRLASPGPFTTSTIGLNITGSTNVTGGTGSMGITGTLGTTGNTAAPAQNTNTIPNRTAVNIVRPYPY